MSFTVVNDKERYHASVAIRMGMQLCCGCMARQRFGTHRSSETKSE